jgi:hypothetical protein
MSEVPVVAVAVVGIMSVAQVLLEEESFLISLFLLAKPSLLSLAVAAAAALTIWAAVAVVDPLPF